MKIGVALFILFALGWLYAIFNVPPDFISQLIPFTLQVPLWWIGAQYLLAAPMREYTQRGGTFRSWWSAIRFGLLTFALSKITLFIIFNWLHLA